EDKGSRYADPVIQQNGATLEDTEGKYGPDIYTDYILDFMERSRDEPFFVYYPMALTHGPFQPTPDSPDWETARHAGGPQYFGDMVEYMDKLVGRIVDKLDALEIRERTLILFLGDNGSPREVTTRVSGAEMRGGKGLTTDAGTRVPLVASWPGTAPEGAVLRDLVDCSDFLPTFMQLADAELPSDDVFDGRSFLPQLRGEAGEPREWVFAHHDPLPGWGKDEYGLKRWAQTHRWKLYDDGSLYDVEADVLEERPLSDNEVGALGNETRAVLQGVLDDMR
ncbi:MAG: sulfatase-like hydrolase/transferase, partial [Candidatus Poribacteria bacterium]